MNNPTLLESQKVQAAAHEVLAELIILNGAENTLDVLRYLYVVTALGKAKNKRHPRRAAR